MAQKDLTSKVLESEPDVFADIFNALLFTSEESQIIEPEKNLTDEPTEGFYKDSNGNNRNMFRDISKEYHRNGIKNILACFNIENESQIKRTVPLKCFGYKYTALKRQQDNYENKHTALLNLRKKAVYEKNKDKIKMIDEELKQLGEFHIAPFISIVLNFDNRPWNEPTNLSDLNYDSAYNKFDEPFHIRVFNVKQFDEKLRSKFKSDFRIFLEMFCTGSLPKGLDSISLRHPTELVDMIVAFTGNRELRNIRNKIAIDELRGVDMDMGNIFEKIADDERYKNTIEIAKRDYKRGKYSTDEIISDISDMLCIDYSKAKEIFEKEVLGLVSV